MRPGRPVVILRPLLSFSAPSQVTTYLHLRLIFSLAVIILMHDLLRPGGTGGWTTRDPVGSEDSAVKSGAKGPGGAGGPGGTSDSGGARSGVGSAGVGGSFGMMTSALTVGYSSAATNFGAINLAIEQAQLDGLLTNETFTFHYRNSNCDSYFAVVANQNLIMLDDVDVILGPYCSASCLSGGYISHYWNMPMLPESCIDATMDNKTVYDTMVRVAGSFSSLGEAFLRVFTYYNWHQVVFVSDTTMSGCLYGINSIIYDMSQSKGWNVAEWIQMGSNPNSLDMQDYISRVQQRGRIVVICHPTISVVGQFLFAAQDAGMTNGDYAFITYSSTPLASVTYSPALFNMTGQNATYRLQALYSLKEITTCDIDYNETAAFLSKVAIRNTEPPWNTILTSPPENPTLTALSLYDATYLFMIIADEMLSKNESISNGTLFLQYAKGRVFNGISGRVEIDQNGDRLCSQSMWAFDHKVQNYTEFIYIDPDLQNMTILSTDVLWSSSLNDTTPPPDVPVCGFFRELCKATHTPVSPYVGATNTIIGVAVGCFAFIVIISVISGVRRKIMERRISQMIWKIKFDDFAFVNNSINAMSSAQIRSCAGALNSSRLSVSDTNHVTDSSKINRLSLTSHTAATVTGALGHLSAAGELLAIYKGTIVSIIQTKKRDAYLTKNDLIDLINKLLDNEDMKLDWFFRISLISDTVNGMAFLHKSPFHSHGRLSSSSCFIDSRLVLKIACLTLPLFRNKDAKRGDEVEGGEEEGGGNRYAVTTGGGGEKSKIEKYGRMLWTAPELLRSNVKLTYGTQKGDVYSFAIVAQEIAYRALPFFMDPDDNPKDIVEAVKRGGVSMADRSNRPVLPTELTEMPQLMTLLVRCWAESPNERPSFDEVKKQLRILNRGRQFDIVDHVLQKLEKYANNLETVVDQRTSELLDEKRKTDLLLNRMLPPYVAEQLKLGRTVPPEVYPSVSVYFSDIVGFTDISSASTPLQIVDLLNDLYGTFDDTISRRDVYKVETIGDAYMVVSGLPRPNEGRHIVEISNMALDLLKEVSVFKIRHRPDLTLKLRIGIHSGPCAAASRIHMSEAARDELIPFPGYRCEKRGETFVKGKGMMTTYWLIDREDVFV